VYSNSILITFCSLLYDQSLNDKNLKNPIIEKKKYEKRILNKWHLFLRLSKNRELIIHRKINKF
jgi:hypothetical protein